MYNLIYFKFPHQACGIPDIFFKMDNLYFHCYVKPLYYYIVRI